MAESMQGLHRSHRCTEVSNKNIGETVTVMGWVQKKRNLGSLIFVDLRDRSGLLQLVFDDNDKEVFEKAGKLRNEFVIAAVGTVNKRAGSVNESMETGDIEINVTSLRILSESETPPIPVDDDANTINIKTSKPYANLVGQLCHPTMGITDVEHIENYDNGIIGTGPYKIEEFNGVGVGYTLAANEYYREDVPYDKINLLFMGDNSAKTMALQSGQVDLVENITNVADIQDFQDSDDFTVDIASGVRCGFAWMNFDGVLGNKTLRQAILMAIDNDTICNSRTIGGLYTPGFSVLPSTLNYDYDKLENPYTYDPEKAKQILDDAGIVDTDGDGIRELDGQNINLRYISYENRLLNDFADAQAQYLAEIGIGVVPEYGSSDDQWSKLAALDYDFNNNNWITVGTGDPLAYMANWATDTSYCAYSNPDYDKLYEELKGEMDPEKRKDLIFQMQQILVDDAAVLIDGYYNSSMIYSKKVGSAHIHTADYYWLSTEITPAE